MGIDLGAIVARPTVTRQNSLVYLPKCSWLSLWGRAKNSLRNLLGFNRLCLDNRQHNLIYKDTLTVDAADQRFLELVDRLINLWSKSPVTAVPRLLEIYSQNLLKVE
jgi:hypothetical protein